MASYNGNIDLLSLNGAQVYKGITRTTPRECMSAFRQA